MEGMVSAMARVVSRRARQERGAERMARRPPPLRSSRLGESSLRDRTDPRLVWHQPVLVAPVSQPVNDDAENRLAGMALGCSKGPEKDSSCLTRAIGMLMVQVCPARTQHEPRKTRGW